MRRRQTDLIRKTAVLTHKRYPQSIAGRTVSNEINRSDDQAAVLSVNFDRAGRSLSGCGCSDCARTGGLKLVAGACYLLIYQRCA